MAASFATIAAKLAVTYTVPQADGQEASWIGHSHVRPFLCPRLSWSLCPLRLNSPKVGVQLLDLQRPLEKIYLVSDAYQHNPLLCCEMYWWARRLRDAVFPAPSQPRLTAATEESGWAEEAPWWPGFPGF